MRKSDSQIQRDVLAELEWDPKVDHTNVGVSVIDGVVTLSGYVRSFAEKLAAERAAGRVAGVSALAEDLKVRYPTDAKTADHEIARRICDVLEWNALVPNDSIKVKVEHGWVTLSGEVNWHYQSEEAKRAASLVSGVVGVSNAINVVNHLSQTDLRHRIEDAFKRQADLDASSVTVMIDGSKVRLSGQVRAPYERRIAEAAVWGAPGVTIVEDHITIKNA